MYTDCRDYQGKRKQRWDKTPEHPGQRSARKVRFWEGVVAGGRKDAWALGQPGWEVESSQTQISLGLYLLKYVNRHLFRL